MSEKKLTCPVEGCNNEVYLEMIDGELYWIDKMNPLQHRGKVMELPSPKRELFLGYAYEKGILKKDSEKKDQIIQYTTQNMKVPVDSKQHIPYDAALLFLIGIIYIIFSFMPFNEFSSSLLYLLGGFFMILGIVEYFSLY